MQLQAITIDFWNTLFDSGNQAQRVSYRQNAIMQELARMGYKNISPDKVESSQKYAWKYFEQVWLNEQRTPDPTEVLRHFWEHLNVVFDDVSLKNLAAKFSQSVVVHPPKPIRGARTALKQLSSKYKLAIVSDTGFSGGEHLRILLENEDLIDFFSAFSFSNETKVSKPHPDAFKKVLADMGVGPKSALHIGDIEQTDIQGALNIGMRAIRFAGDPITFIPNRSPAETKAELMAEKWNTIAEYLLEKD